MNRFVFSPMGVAMEKLSTRSAERHSIWHAVETMPTHAVLRSPRIPVGGGNGGSTGRARLPAPAGPSPNSCN